MSSSGGLLLEMKGRHRPHRVKPFKPEREGCGAKGRRPSYLY